MDESINYINKLHDKGSNRTLSESIELKCYDCIVDPLVAGTWLQQIACCDSACCALHDHRPVPKPYNKGKNLPMSVKIAIVEKLEAIDRARNER